MTWTAPIDPPADGNAITRAFYITYVKDNLAHLRVVTGGDPPGANYALISSGSGVGAWTTVPDNAMTNPKVTKAGDQMSGALEIEKNTSATINGSFPALAGLRMRTTGGTTNPAIEFDKSSVNNAAIYYDGTDFKWVNAGAVIKFLVSSPDDNDIKVTSPGRVLITANGTAAAPLLSIGANENTGLFASGNNEIGFSTGGTQRGRIADTGVIIWGTSPPANRGSDNILLHNNALATGTWDTTSDARIKQNIERVTEPLLDRLLEIPVVAFERKSTPERRELGVIAQDVLPVLDHVIVEGEMHSLNTTALLAAVLKGLQELAAYVRYPADHW